MSGHLIGCAGQVNDPRLGTSHKLALVAFADSGDDRTHIGFPGYEEVQKWAMCSRGRAAELIRDLVEFGYLKPHKRGHRGQRAEYVVFPDGCCDLHRTPAVEAVVDVDQLAASAGVSVEAARALLAAMNGGTAGSPQEKGSDAPDSIGGNGSDAPDPNYGNAPTSAPDAPESVDDGVLDAGKGPERIQRSRSNANAFTPSKEFPLTPASGGTGCARHKTPATNCRGCGTTNRQLAAARRVEAAAAHRAAEAAAIAAELAKPRGRKPGTENLRAAARAGIAVGRQKATTTSGATR